MNDKDQAAIDHVASVSNHPHAAMIVKWLITGWDVEFQHATGEWKISDYPTWSPGSKYRLIEPKPAKPAYRVYGGKNGTNTVDRLPNGSLSHGIPDGAEWLSDWIEYDPPTNKWPTPLVERIAAIDIKAAEWIVDNWDELLDEKYSHCVTVGRESDRLHTMFNWRSSPQGRKYWEKMAKKLRKHVF